MKNCNYISTRGKLFVLDQGALIDADFVNDMFRYGIAKVLITHDGETVASMVRRYDKMASDQFAARKIVFLPFESDLCVVPDLPFAGLVRMATEGDVALALETKSDGSKYLLLTASAEKFDPDDENVVVLKGTGRMRIGYQLYCDNPTVGQIIMGGPIDNFEDFKRKEMERICS